MTDLSPIDLLMLQSADADEQDRLVRFKLGWAVYDGDMERPLAVKSGERDDNVIVPLARSFVDTSVKFLLGEDLKFKGDDERVNEVVEAAWSGGTGRSNTKMLTLNKLAINGGVTGHFFLKLVPQADKTCRLVVIDPSYVSVLWSQEDIDVVRRYRIQWSIIDKDAQPAVRRQDVTRQDNGTWLIEDFVNQGRNNQWRLIGSTAWPYDFAPLIDAQNLIRPNEYWGQSDLEGGLIQINNAINSVLSDVKKILTFHASPKTKALGMTPDQFDELNASPDSLYFLPEGADIQNLELSGDLAASMNAYKELKSALHEVASIPEVATGRVENIGNLSARAMQILYKPLIDLTTTKRMTYGHGIDEVNRRVCIIAGIKDPQVPDILWPDILPKDSTEERDAAEADLRMGIASKDTIAAKLGYDWDQESEKIAAETSSAAEATLTNFDRGNTTGADAFGV